MITGAPNPPERRSAPRLSGAELAIGVRLKGRLVGVGASALDFNRFGVAVHTRQPLPKDRVVFVWLAYADVRLDNLVAVVHNCVRDGDGYRSGIRFRTNSELQLDRARVEYRLVCIEQLLAEAAGVSLPPSACALPIPAPAADEPSCPAAETPHR